MRLKSIRARMTAAFALSIGVLMLLASGGLVWYAARSAENSADASLKVATTKIRSEINEGNSPNEIIEAISEEFEGPRSDNLAMVLIDGKGRTMWKSQGNAPAPSDPGFKTWRATRSTVGQGTLVVEVPWKATSDALKYHAIVLASLSLFMMIITTAGAWVLVGRTLSPIASLARGANTARTDSLRISLGAPSQDAEIVELVETLNGLLSRLSETAASKGRFYSAASHELRTPLQALSGHLELALAKPRTSEEYHEVITEAYKQARRLISLVQDLLILNRLDLATTQPPKEPVNLAEICDRELAHLRPMIASKGLRVEEVLPDTEIPALPTHADMLIRNLIENAVKYASDGGRVSVRLSVAENAPMLEVFNECPPIPLSDLNQLFEPFFRPDPSRRSSTGGNGLGLAICKAIAVANDWRISLSQDPSGVRATVTFTP